MPTPGRSADDLPLAAYSTGVDPETEPAIMAAATTPTVATPPAAPASPGVLPAGPFDAVVVQGPAGDDEAASPPRIVLARARAFASRNPRPVAGGAFITMILVGLMLLSGGKPAPSAAGAVASPGAPTIAPVAVDPGAATLVLTGGVKGTFTFTGNPGQPVAGSAVTASWVDTLQNVLTLDGPVDRGTRMTDAGLVLTWGLMLDGKLVTFTSKAGECTIGMASTPKSVTGSFACKKLKSDDGKLTVGAAGTYRT